MSDPGWTKRKEEIDNDSHSRSRDLSSEANSYFSSKCTNCPHRNYCDNFDPSNGGCKTRKDIYENLFTEMKFKREDAITLNRMRLLSKYFVELILRRNFGLDYSKSEMSMYKITIHELGKLSIDKKGELIDSQNKTILPWEASEDDQVIQQELDRLRKLEMEVKKKKVKKDAKSD